MARSVVDVLWVAEHTFVPASALLLARAGPGHARGALIRLFGGGYLT